MAERDKGAVASVSRELRPPEMDISAAQKMLSAVSGSVMTSLLVTPLDVVRVRLQSQPQAPTSQVSHALPSNPSNNIKRFSNNLGVTACCREVFWVNNNAQLCIATPNTASISAVSTPAHTTTLSVENCAVEETRRKAFTSTFDGLQKIARNEGILTLWRGLSPTLVMAIPANVIYFTGYDYLRYNSNSPIRKNIPENYSPLVAGSVARVAAAVAVSPIEMFRTRMQASSGSDTSIVSDTFKGMKELVQVQGVTSLWRGLTLTMWRDVPFSGFYWWGYEVVRNALTDARERQRGRSKEPSASRAGIRNRSRSQENKKSTFVDSFIAGATSGAVASLVTTPFDVGKTRQQVFHSAQDMRATATSVSSSSADLMPEQKSMPRFLYHIFKTEGVAGLFRGWAARCLKVAPACAIMISSYEVGKKMAQRSNDRRMAERAAA